MKLAVSRVYLESSSRSVKNIFVFHMPSASSVLLGLENIPLSWYVRLFSFKTIFCQIFNFAYNLIVIVEKLVF